MHLQVTAAGDGDLNQEVSAERNRHSSAGALLLVKSEFYSPVEIIGYSTMSLIKKKGQSKLL